MTVVILILPSMKKNDPFTENMTIQKDEIIKSI